MAQRPLVIAPDRRLSQECTPVESVTAEIRQIIADMFDTMYANIGWGLAAPQIGVLKRIVVIDMRDPEDPEDPFKDVGPLALINPEITWYSDEVCTLPEGCLSIPEQRVEVTRPEKVTVKFLDAEGKSQERTADDYFARCIQHELDHLNGVLSIDHLSSLKKSMIVKRLQKWQRFHDYEGQPVHEGR